MEKLEEKLIEKLKLQTNELWQTIQEAKKSNIEIRVGFDDNLTKRYLKLFKVLY
jgi:hypothetical protein